MLQKTGVRTITVYASSSQGIAPVYFEAAKDLGERMAALGIACINGAGNNGLMASVTDAVWEKAGKSMELFRSLWLIKAGFIPIFTILRLRRTCTRASV